MSRTENDFFYYQHSVVTKNIVECTGLPKGALKIWNVIQKTQS